MAVARREQTQKQRKVYVGQLREKPTNIIPEAKSKKQLLVSSVNKTEVSDHRYPELSSWMETCGPVSAAVRVLDDRNLGCHGSIIRVPHPLLPWSGFRNGSFSLDRRRLPVNQPPHLQHHNVSPRKPHSCDGCNVQ